MDRNSEITFYDSVSGKPLFVAPRGRTFEEFKKESQSHGWPSFRDQEVSLWNFLYVRYFTMVANSLCCYGILSGCVGKYALFEQW